MAKKPTSKSKRSTPPSRGVRSQAPSKTSPSRANVAATRASAGTAKSKPASAAARASESANSWARVTARDLMQKNMVTVRENAPLNEVERVLADAHVFGAPVVDESDRIVGVLSVKDLLDRYAEEPDARPDRRAAYFRISMEELAREDLRSLRVPSGSTDRARDVMSAQIFTVPPEAGVKEIADAMCTHKVHRVLVEDDGKLVGLVSTLDVMEALRV
jgi:CBS domain-containing protein